MSRWIEGPLSKSRHCRPAQYALDTPLGRVTVKPRLSAGAPVAWIACLPDGATLEQSDLYACMDQAERVITLRLERIDARQRSKPCQP